MTIFCLIAKSEFLFDDMSTLLSHFVSSPRERRNETKELADKAQHYYQTHVAMPFQFSSYLSLIYRSEKQSLACYSFTIQNIWTNLKLIYRVLMVIYCDLWLLLWLFKFSSYLGVLKRGFWLIVLLLFKAESSDIPVLPLGFEDRGALFALSHKNEGTMYHVMSLVSRHDIKYNFIPQ